MGKVPAKLVRDATFTFAGVAVLVTFAARLVGASRQPGASFSRPVCARRRGAARAASALINVVLLACKGAGLLA